jgi:hypothetical protein
MQDKPSSQNAGTIALLLILMSTILVTIPFASATAGKPPLRVTSSEMYFVPGAVFVEPFLSTDPKLEALKLSRLFNQKELFPKMHHFTKGDGVILVLRRGGSPKVQRGPHLSFWTEEITLQIPSILPEKGDTKTLDFQDIKGYFSWRSGRIMWLDSIAVKGAVALATLDEKRIRVDIDIYFKRVDVDPEYSSIDDERDKVWKQNLLRRPEVFEINNGPSPGHQTIRIKESFVAHKRLYEELEVSDRGAYTKEEERAERDRYDREIYEILSEDGPAYQE